MSLRSAQAKGNSTDSALLPKDMKTKTKQKQEGRGWVVGQVGGGEGGKPASSEGAQSTR